MNPKNNEFGFVALDFKDDEDFDNNINDDFNFTLLDEPEEYIDEEEIESEFIDPDESPGFLQRIASNPLTQAALGVARRATYPLDIAKMIVTGEALTDLDEIENVFEKSGKPFDRQEYINKVLELSEYFPTQQLAENVIKEKTGISLEPQDKFSKILRTGSEIAATGPKGLLNQPSKQISKRVGGGIAASAAGEGLKELGVPEPIADLSAFVSGGAAAGKTLEKSLPQETKKLRETAEKFNLRKFKGLESEKIPKNAIVSKSSKIKAIQELSETSKNAIDKIVEGKLPIKKIKDYGTDLEDAYTVAYELANNTAKTLKDKPVNINNVVSFIKDKIKTIKNSAPSLSSTDQSVLKELKKQYKQLTTPSTNPKIRLAKQPTAEQILDQYKNFNEEVKGIYRKPEFSGSESVIKNLYGELNSELINSLEKYDSKLASQLKFANKIYSETSKLNQTEAIMQKAFENGYNPSKLNRILGGKSNRSFLERNLGKGAVQDIKDIAHYGEQAEKKVLSAIKNPKTVAEIASELTPLKASLLLLKKASILPLAYEIPKSIVNRVQGWLFLRPNTRKSYSDFVKNAVSPTSPAFKKASQSLTKAIEDEFGSENEFLDFIFNEE